MSLTCCAVIGQGRTCHLIASSTIGMLTGCVSLMVMYGLLMSVFRESCLHGCVTSDLCMHTVVIAEVTQPSLGVGYELGRAVDMKKKILCLFRPSSGRCEDISHLCTSCLPPDENNKNDLVISCLSDRWSVTSWCDVSVDEIATDNELINSLSVCFSVAFYIDLCSFTLKHISKLNKPKSKVLTWWQSFW